MTKQSRASNDFQMYALLCMCIFCVTEFNLNCSPKNQILIYAISSALDCVWPFKELEIFKRTTLFEMG